MRLVSFLMSLLLSLGWVSAHAAQPAAVISDAEIRQILTVRAQALAPNQSGIGIVAGVVSPQGRKVFSSDPKMNGDTAFEIGSVTKVFTALLLSDMVRTGEVKLEDPVTKYLPPGLKLPERNGRSITLLDLATHTSGLPFMPDDLPTYGPNHPADYSSDRLYQFLSRYKLTREPGKEWAYSNLDYWLLGQALEHKAGMDYEHLVRQRILGSLQMNSTEIAGSPKPRAIRAIGYNAALQPAPRV